MEKLESIAVAYRLGREREAAGARSAAEWWLEEMELPTERAEAEAARAFRSARHGDLLQALCHAEQACRLEKEEYRDCPTWQPLHQAILAAIEEPNS